MFIFTYRYNRPYKLSADILSSRAPKGNRPGHPKAPRAGPLPAVAHLIHQLMPSSRPTPARNALLSLATIPMRPAVDLRECSHIRRTFHLRKRNSRVLRPSRRRFPRIFAFQYGLLSSGNRKQSGHPCQKHPSMNTTTRLERKTKSGLPGSFGCLRHPEIFAFRRSRIKAHSVVALPFERMLAMFRERCSRDSQSAIAYPNDLLQSVISTCCGE
jgi:hypothetical protein